jgi:hypothetical protein
MGFTINGTTVMQGDEVIGSFSYRTDTIVAVYDYRDDTGYIGNMSYQQMLNYFEGFETE